MMRSGPASRRSVLRALGATPLLLSPFARAQPGPARLPVVGVLANHVPRAHLEMGASSPFDGTAAFVQDLARRGWIEGRNVRFAWRSAEGRIERLPSLAAELVRMPVDVIAGGDYAAEAAFHATSTIPVVAYAIGRPMERGFAVSMSRPGRNLTGLTVSAGAELQKSLAWLKEASPGIRHVAYVARTYDMADNGAGLRPGSPLWAAGAALDVDLSFMTFGDGITLPDLVRSAARQGVHALMVDPEYAIHYHREVRERLASELIRVRMPAMHLALVAAAHGGLMAHGDDLTARWRRAAYFVDRILRGEKPAEIPIEHSNRLEFHVNLKAAKAIGLELPARLILQADRVFE